MTSRYRPGNRQSLAQRWSCGRFISCRLSIRTDSCAIETGGDAAETTLNRRHLIALSLGAVLSGCGRFRRNERPAARDPGDLHPGETPELRALIQKYAHTYQMPENLLHRVIQRESGYNPSARNGNYYGLMQVDPRTAKTMGYDGPAEGLLDAETNLIYAGRYLRGAWLVSRGDEDMAIVWYSKGYYYEAKRMGLLEETGLRT